jgi:hypothetical protein
MFNKSKFSTCPLNMYVVMIYSTRCHKLVSLSTLQGVTNLRHYLLYKVSQACVIIYSTRCSKLASLSTLQGVTYILSGAWAEIKTLLSNSERSNKQNFPLWIM